MIHDTLYLFKVKEAKKYLNNSDFGGQGGSFQMAIFKLTGKYIFKKPF